MASNQVTVLGAGFAALTAIKTLRKRNADVDITLIAPKSEFIYYPSLIWVPSGKTNAEDLRINIRPFMSKHQVRYIQANVTNVIDLGRTVLTDNYDYEDVNNDGLIIATGGSFIKKLKGIEHAITICEGIEAAEKMKTAVRELQGGTITLGFSGNPKEPSAMRGGPMFELLFGLDTQLRQEGRREKFELVFFCPSERPGARLGEKAVDGILREMEKRNIKSHLGHKIVEFTENKVITEGGEINTDLILFMPGMTGPTWAQKSDLPLSEGGFIQATQHTEVLGYHNTYVAGDAGSFPGPDWKPKQAHMADLQAVCAADNLIHTLIGLEPSHEFKYELACIIDSLNKGTLAYRTEKRSFVTPSSRLLHTAKKVFEWNYLRQYRKLIKAH